MGATDDDVIDDLLARAASLGPLLEASAGAIEADRRLPDEVVRALREAGLFRMTMPKAWGGLEVDPLTQVRALEQVAYHDASAAWVAMICCDGGYYTGFLTDQDAARALYPDLDLLTAGWLVPAGTARRVDGGFEVTGRWSFGSGILHSERVVGGCLEVDESGLVLDEHGAPHWFVAFLPREAVTVHDTWHTTGLCGTSSDDYEVRQAFVPEAHTFHVLRPPERTGPLYRYHGFFFAKVVAVPLGLLRRAIDEFDQLARTKVSAPAMTPISAEPRVQVALAAAHADLDAAWGLVERTYRDVWSTVSDGDELTPRQRAAVGAMAVWVIQTVKRAVGELCDEAGTAAGFRANRLERVRRDVLQLSHHVIGQRKTYEVVGQYHLGLPPRVPLF